MITANTWFRMSFPLFMKTKIFPAQERFQIKPAGIDREEHSPVKAFVNHGAWLVQCPDSQCGGAEYAWEEGFYYCFSCHNGYMKHRIRRLSFPVERKDIEALLEQRPLLNRNWSPGETIEDLRIENIEHCKELLPIELFAPLQGEIVMDKEA